MSTPKPNPDYHRPPPQSFREFQREQEKEREQKQHMPTHTLQEMLQLYASETSDPDEWKSQLLEAIATCNNTELQEFCNYIHGAGSRQYNNFKWDCSATEKRLLHEKLGNLERNEYMVSPPHRGKSSSP